MAARSIADPYPSIILAARISGRFEQEPGAAFGLVDPDFQEARGGDIAVFVADAVDRAHSPDELLVVVAKFSQHVLRLDVVRIVVEDTLMASDLPDRAQCCSADLASPFRDRVRHRAYLVALLVEQQVVVAEVATAHVPA